MVIGKYIQNELTAKAMINPGLQRVYDLRNSPKWRIIL